MKEYVREWLLDLDMIDYYVKKWIAFYDDVREWLLDLDMIDYYVKKWIAFYDDFIIWSKAHRLNFHKVNKYLPYKKI